MTPAAGFSLLLLIAVPSWVNAGEVRLFAPLVRGHARAETSLLLTDRSERGALVDVYLRHASGSPLRYGQHPITITRALPPGETMTIELDEYLQVDFDGSLELHATAEVSASLRMPMLRYDLAAPSLGADISLGERTSHSLRLAACGTGGDAEVEFAYRRGSNQLVIDLGAYEAVRRRLAVPSGATGFRWEASYPVVSLVWQPVDDQPAIIFHTN